MTSVAAVTAVVAPIRDAAARRRWRVDAAWLAAGALILRLPAFFASRHLTFDDGQYGSAILGMRDGAAPFRDLFSSQGPLHYPLLWVADVVGFRTLDGPRVETVAAGLVAAIAAYAIGRRLTTRTGALLAGALVATSGSVLYVTAPLSGDGPALALSLTAIALALAYRAQPSVARAIGVGLAIGAGLSVKPLVLPAALAVGMVLLGVRRWRECAAAAGAAAAVFLAAALPWGIGNVWDQTIAYHRDSERLRSVFGNLRVLLQTLVERDPFVVATLVLATVGVVLTMRRAPATAATIPREIDDRTAVLLLGVWLGAQALFLIIEPAMWRPHVSQVVAPLAILAVARPPSWRAVLVVAVVLSPWWVANTHEILWPDGYDRDEQAVVDRLRALPDGAWVISDDPGFTWRAEHRVPGNFVDVSEKRIQQRQLTAKVIARAAARPRVCSVVVWSERRFGSLSSLPRRLEAEGYEVVKRFDEVRRIYERPDCPA